MAFALPDVRAIDLASALRSLLRRRSLAVASELTLALLRGYRRHIVLTKTEVETLPTLLRLCSAVSAIWWLGRGLAAGDTAAIGERLLRAHRLAQSLEQHESAIQSWLI